MPARVRSGAVVFAALASVAFAQGGLEPRTWRLATLAFLALAAAALLSRAEVQLSRLECWTLALFAAVVVWTALSATWSSDPSASFLQAERVLVYASALLALLVCCERADVLAVLVGTVAAITVVGAYALARKAFAPPPIDEFEGSLLFQPLGYANGLGIFATVGILVSLGLGAAWDGRRRLAAVAPLAILVPTLYFTSSRGAGLALVAGLVALVVLAGGTRRPVVVAAAGVAVVAILAIAVLATRGSRLSPLGKDRPRYWHAALADYRGHPGLGAGSGTFGAYWLHHRPDGTFTRTPHSLYLESLADLGPVGVLLVAGALLVPFGALRRGRTPLATAAAGAYVASVVHTGLDWDWELPAATLAGVACAGALLLEGRVDSTALSGRARTALVVALAAVAALEAFRAVAGPMTPYGS